MNANEARIYTRNEFSTICTRNDSSQKVSESKTTQTKKTAHAIHQEQLAAATNFQMDGKELRIEPGVV